MIEMIAFKINDSASKKDLREYAIRRGFRDENDMARVVFYTYLKKVHYPFKDENTEENNDNK